MKEIPLHKPAIGSEEIKRVTEVLESGEIKGGGKFDQKCSSHLEKRFGTPRAMMTTSCTHSLEMAALLLDIEPGDKVIMPSYTFTSTATAFALYGADIHFCEINSETLNMDPKALREGITEDTVAVVPVHYAGVACEMDEITAIANEYDAAVVEDAAQALNSTYDGEQLGTIGDIGCFSFHGTKSYVAGEGGAIFLNDESYVKRAERIRQKGTNYEEFKRNEVDRYQWVDIGSSYVPSELQTALAYTQLTRMDEISSEQKYIFEKYTDALHNLEIAGLIELPSIPSYCSPNYHMYPLLTQKEKQRDELVSKLQVEGIGAASHYEPLHTSPYGRQYGYEEGDLPITESVSNRLLRIPIHTGMDDTAVETVIRVIEKFYN